MSETELRFPATMIVHWPSGPVPCCDKHGRELLGLSNFLGSHIAATVPTEAAECTNCLNEAGKA